tara:strand:+ start:215 stop:1615 length:1401 start_codon:yes stop_codon:yes gene_type:complete
MPASPRLQALLRAKEENEIGNFLSAVLGGQEEVGGISADRYMEIMDRSPYGTGIPMSVGYDEDSTMSPLDMAAIVSSAIPIVGDVTGLAADADMYARDPESRNMVNYLLSAAGAIPLIPAASQVRKTIKAYHGSPHDFDEFSNDAIGTGEGAQAYGYGHYLAESEDVATGYKNALTEPFIAIDGKPADLVYTGEIRERFSDIYDAATDEPMIHEYIVSRIDELDDPDVAYDRVSAIVEKFKEGSEYTREFDELAEFGIDPDEIYDLVSDQQGLDSVIANISQAQTERDLPFVLDGFDDEQTRIYQRYIEPKLEMVQPEGRLYEVEIDANEDDLLDWDELLDDQPEKVRQALAKTDWYEYADEGAALAAERRGENPAGRDLVKWLEEDGAEEAAQALKDSGIKGIKYADAFTRHKTKDRRSSNYVIFDPRLIQISKKLGVAIPVAAALIANKTGQDPQELYQEDPSV